MLTHVFCDKTEEEKELICNVLDKYCIPYTKEKKEERGMYYQNITWDISITLSLKPTMTLKDGTKISPYNFAMKKVNERIQLLKSYNLPAVERDEFINLEDPKPIGEVLEEMTKGITGTSIDEIKQQLKDSGLEPKIKKTLRDRLFPSNKEIQDNLKPIIDNINNSIQNIDKLCKSFTEVEKSSYKQDDLNDFISGIDPKNIIKFKDLPLYIKDALCSKYSKELLESDKCIIYVDGRTIGVIIST